MGGSEPYELGRVFALRPTGVPFDVLEALATPAASAAAREVLARTAELAAHAAQLAELIGRSDSLPLGERQKLRRKIFKHVRLTSALELAEVVRYHELLAGIADAERQLADTLAREHATMRQQLHELAEAHLPLMIVLQLGHDALAGVLGTRSHRNDRKLATWLQRVCAKNDTISRWGPSAWGTVDPAEPGSRISPTPGIARAEAWIERWVVYELIAAINADPGARAELAPRVHPHAEVTGSRVAWHDTGAVDELTAAEQALVARCDGRTPAHELGHAGELAALAERRVLIWQLESLFLDDDPLATATADIAAWRAGPVRDRWAALAQRLAELATAYRVELDPAGRKAITDRTYALLTELGIAARQRTGRLYEAVNPIVEDCFRAGDFALGQAAVDELIADASPWFDLFRDACSVAADRVHAELRELYVKAPRHHGRLSLAGFLAFADARGMRPNGPPVDAIAAQAFTEIRRGFAQRLAGRADAPAWELAPEECRFLAGDRIPRRDIAYPSADLQLAAASPDAVARGDYEWVISELHHHIAPMGHSMSWSCPDPAALCGQLRAAQLGEPFLFFDARFPSHAPVHTGVGSVLDGFAPANIATELRTRPGWHSYAPALVELVLDDERPDIRARCVRTGADLGSLCPMPRFFTGLHPFFPLRLEHHTPRLRRGRTVLQRRTWSITADELAGQFAEVSPALVLAVERLRAARDLPRWVFMRVRGDLLPSTDLLPDKDAKPICIDLESYVFIDIFARRLQKYRYIELVEMLPAPHQLLWRDPDGRRTFEMRTQLVPRASTIEGR